jgi:hypothetical protein
MGKIVRISIAVLVILSFVIWARSESAAADTASSGDQSLQSGAGLSASADVDDCKNGKNKDKDRCKCKDDDGKKKDCGTVKPPKDKDKVCKDQRKSVGGVVVVAIKERDERECVDVSTRNFDPVADQLPPGLGRAVSDTVTLAIPSPKSLVTICFAAPPLGQELKILASSTNTWLTIQTTVDQGMACAAVPGSGKYLLVAL